MLKFEQKLPFLSCTYEGEDVLAGHRYPLARPPRPPSSCDAPLLARGGVLPPRDLRGLPRGGGLGVPSCPPPPWKQNAPAPTLVL